MEKKKISIIVPCYNEEKVINVFYDRIIKVMAVVRITKAGIQIKELPWVKLMNLIKLIFMQYKTR